MSFVAVRSHILEDLKPRLDRALAAHDDTQLYGIVPEIQSFLNDSANFSDEMGRFLADSRDNSELISFQSHISEATQRMEVMAQRYFIERMASFDDASKIAFIQGLGTQGSDFACPVLNFERLPELQREKQAAGIDHNSKVLILGAGSISISGLYFASHGAEVTLLDRDPRAISTFRTVYDLLPRDMQQRISFERPCDARDYTYPQDVTHIFLAALLEPKEPIIAKIRECYDCASHLTLLLRTPREDLMQLFYYDVDKSCLCGLSLVEKVDMGHAAQTSKTLILRMEGVPAENGTELPY